MDVVVHAWHWRATFATAKRLPSLAAGTAAILVRRTSKAGTGGAEYIEQREGIYRLSRRSGLQIHLFSSHPVRLVGSGDGLADLLVRAAGITELLAKS
jgi:hypothetical protein